ncbi:MAG TPA: DUF2336 domain-containing protein, partial [Xanthobacteraceae bacterium]|nr:DUF2336 domain-containing protein [Xanthobacteraceae bacterium]
RGDREVVRSVARNPGARFSDSGFWRLVQRSENDVVLTLEVGGRRDIPRHLFQKLISKASEEVRVKLAAVNPLMAGEIGGAVAQATGALHARFGPGSKSYFAAKRQVGQMHRAGEITERAICEFARQNAFEEVVVALSLVCDLPVDVVERALLDEDGEMILIVAKIANLSWSATKVLLIASRGTHSEQDMEQALRSFSQLSVNTARQVLAFYRSRSAKEEILDSQRA